MTTSRRSTDSTPRERPGASSPAVAALMDRAFDYAGLFPPASLDIDEAVHEYLDRLETAPGWMLGPFVIEMDRLNELRAFSNLFDPSDPFKLDILIPGGNSADDFSREVPLQLATCRMFADRHPTTHVTAFETRLPRDILTAGRAERVFESVADSLDFAGFGDARLFVELERGPTLSAQLPVVFEAMAGLGTDAPIAAKFRCGGADPSDYPDPGEVARVIHESAKSDHPFKLTAGLHHPFRHETEQDDITMHGFVNVFLAAAIARAHDVDLDVIESIVAETDPDAFILDEATLGWGDYTVTAEEIADSRHHSTLSIGSCSFDEPRDDLRELGWLS